MDAQAGTPMVMPIKLALRPVAFIMILIFVLGGSSTSSSKARSRPVRMRWTRTACA